MRRHAWPVVWRWAGAARGAGHGRDRVAKMGTSSVSLACHPRRICCRPCAGEFLVRMRSSARVAMTCRVWACVALTDRAAGGLAGRHDRAQAECDRYADTGGQAAIHGGPFGQFRASGKLMWVLYSVDFNIFVKYSSKTHVLTVCPQATRALSCRPNSLPPLHMSKSWVKVLAWCADSESRFNRSTYARK